MRQQPHAPPPKHTRARTPPFSLTSFGEPEHSGRREWPALQAWVGRRLEGVVRDWLGSFELVKAEGAQFDPANKYIFGCERARAGRAAGREAAAASVA